MSTALKLEWEEEEEAAWLGIHSLLSDFRLAFQLNKQLGLQMSRSKDIDFGEMGLFPLFEFEDLAQDCYCCLLPNQQKQLQTNPSMGLFAEEVEWRTRYILPERKEIDYLIKLSGQFAVNPAGWLNKIKEIPRVITAYHLEPNTLKSKQNLIF